MESEPAREKIEGIRKKTGLDELIVHTPYFAAIASNSEGAAAVQQNYCANPVRTTGAGGTLSGGYMSVCLKDLKHRGKAGGGQLYHGVLHTERSRVRQGRNCGRSYKELSVELKTRHMIPVLSQHWVKNGRQVATPTTIPA